MHIIVLWLFRGVRFCKGLGLGLAHGFVLRDRNGY